jgi:iron complex outermembrane receptor protein
MPLLFIVVLLLALPAWAQTAGGQPDESASESLLFQEIPSVFGASKYEQTVSEAPSSVTIITDEEIRRYGYRSFADILGSARGFYTTNDRNYMYAGIRGFGRPGDFNSRLLVLVDGFRINDPIFHSVGIGLDFPLDVDLIDRVEIARGPSSSLYGTSAFFGVVNIITKDGRQLGGAQLQGSLGSFDTGAGRVSYGDRFENGAELILSSTVYDSDGQDLFYPEFIDENNGVTQGTDYLNHEQFFGKLRFNDFTVQGAYQNRKKGIPTASYETVFNDPGTFTMEGSARLGITYDRRFDSGLALTGRLGYDDIHEDGEYVYVYDELENGELDLVANQDYSRSQRVTSEITLTKQLNDRHRVVGGAEYRDSFRMDQQNYDREVYLDDQRSSNVVGVYAQDEYSLTESFLINAGLRYDHYGFGESASSVSPRIAAIYSPLEDTTLKVLYGQAFRAPTAYELFYNDSGIFQKGAQTLDPELMRSTEVVVEQRVGAAWQFTGSVYRYDIDSLITQVEDPVDELFVFRNVEDIDSTGAEFEVEGRSADGWTGRAGYGVQRTREQPGDVRLSNSPRHLLKLNLIAPLADGRIFAGAEGLYVSSRRTLADTTTDGYFLTNLTVSSGALLRGWDVSASVYNLFDQRYGDPGGSEHLQTVIIQDGRNFRVRFGYNFGR